MAGGRIIRNFASAVIMLAVLVLFPFRVSAAADRTVTNIFVYMIASDLESHDAAATEDINEMLKAAKKFGDEINLFVYAGGAENWHNSIFSSEENRCVKIDNNGAGLIYSEETKDMTNPQTLSRFIRYCARRCPAGRNILILWDHGGGCRGFGADELNEYSKHMNSIDIADAISSSGAVFDIIGFDACMMSSVDMAFAISDYTDYMVASEEMEITAGWDYTAWLSALALNPETSGVEICKKIVDSYMNYCRAEAPEIKSTLTVIDVKKLSENVPQALTGFSDKMLDNLLNGNYDIEKMQRALITQLSKANRVDMIDAVEFASKVGGTEGKDLENAIRGTIVYHRKYPEELKLNGILIYIPIKSDSIMGVSLDDIDTLRGMGLDESFLDWLTCFRKYMALGRDGQSHERTLLDVLKGSVRNDYDDAIASAVSSTRLDVSGCYIEEDEYLVPHLMMTREKKRLVAYICQGLSVTKGDIIADYGDFLFEPEAFPLEYNGFWKRMCDDWLYINDVLTPFYMEEKTKRGDGKIEVYGYTRMTCNNDEGVLYLKVIYDDSDGSITVEPVCFQEVDFINGDGQFGRVRPMSTIDPESIVSFTCSVFSMTEGTLMTESIIDGMNWEDITKFEWKYTEDIDNMDTSYAVTDLYGMLHIIEFK